MTLGRVFWVYNKEQRDVQSPKGISFGFRRDLINPQLPVSPSASLLGAYATILVS